MSRSALKPARNLGTLGVLGAGMIAACSVDTSDIRFLPDAAFEQHEAGDGGVANVGGVGNVGAVGNIGGAMNLGGKAGSGSGGASSGGSKLTGGTNAGGMGGMSPMRCTPGTADRTQGEIDNLEDADSVLPPNAGRRGGWYTYNDGTSTQLPRPNMPSLPEMGGAMGTQWAMHTSGGPFTLWGAGLGIVLNGYADAPPCRYDVSSHAGLRFWARGATSNTRLRVLLATADTQLPAQGGTCQETNVDMPVCGDHYGYDFPLPTDWQQFDVAWDDLAQNGWGKPAPLQLDRVLNIEFTVVRDVVFDVWIDQVAFY